MTMARLPGRNGETNYPSDYGQNFPNGMTGALYDTPGLGGGAGLDAVHPGPADPYNHAKVQHALDVIEQHPGISAQMMQTIMAEALGPAQAQIDQRQQASTQAFDTASQGLLGLATSGQGTPQGLDALTNAYQAISPSLNRPAMDSRLSDVSGSLGQLSATIPSATGVPADSGTVFAADIPAIDANIKDLASGTTKQANGLPYGLHEAVMGILQQYRAQGVPQDQLDILQRFIEQKWQEYGGPARPGGGY